MSHDAEISLISWKPVNEWILTAQFKTKYLTLAINQCYAPTNEDTDTKKICFTIVICYELNAAEI